MKKKNLSYGLFILIILAGFLFVQSGCNKDDDGGENPSGTTSFNVSLESTNTSRSSYEHVYIDIQKVSFHTSADTSVNGGWVELETNAGIYDLLDYENGNDTIIGFDPVLEVQTISQIRLLLGPDNTIVESGETYDLETPSAQTSGLKIQVNAPLEPNKAYKVVLDFDVDKSILKTGNDKYKLKPVIKAQLVEM